jgi:hypothetical protein
MMTTLFSLFKINECEILTTVTATKDTKMQWTFKLLVWKYVFFGKCT